MGTLPWRVNRAGRTGRKAGKGQSEGEEENWESVLSWNPRRHFMEKEEVPIFNAANRPNKS